jgi:hypothetical protein
VSILNHKLRKKTIYFKVDSTTEDSVNENSILGNWNLVENENADEYLRAVGAFHIKVK